MESGLNFNFLLIVPMGVNSYLDRVVPPNKETTPIGVTGTFKVGLGVLHVITPLDYKENRLIHYFFTLGRGLTPVIINRGALEPPFGTINKS